MGKEAKLGVALIAVLLGVFGFVLYKRLKDARHTDDPLAQAAADEASKPAEAEKPKLASGPLKSGPIKSPATAGSVPVSQTAAQTPAASPRYSSATAASSELPATSGASADPFRSVAADSSNNAPSSAGAGSSASSRYGDRYSSTATAASSRLGSDGGYGSTGNDRYRDASAQIYGPSATESAQGDAVASGSATANSSGGPLADPFAPPSQRSAASKLTPTSDASAALLPAAAMEESSPVPQAAETAEAESTTDAASAQALPSSGNPLRPAAAQSTTPESSGRFRGPRSYDIYGETTSTETAASSEPSPKSGGTDLTSGNTAADRYSSTSRSSLDDRYGSTGLSSGGAYAGNGDRYATPSTKVEPSTSDTSRTSPDRSSWNTSTPSVSTSTSGTASSRTSTPSVTSSGIGASTVGTKPADPYTPRSLPTASQRGETYVVGPNDNFWTISQKVYGSGSYFKALQEHNRAQYPRPDLLQTGDVIATPAVEILRSKYPKLCPKPEHVFPAGRSGSLAAQRSSGGRLYVVEEGDTLFDIARFELGKATRWVEIYELNKDVIGEDFNHLRPGTQLVLPPDVEDDSYTRRPGSFIQR